MDYKLRQIEPLMKTYPMRKFILIGDSGEKDPEIYAELYRRYPGRIEQIGIHSFYLWMSVIFIGLLFLLIGPNKRCTAIPTPR